MNTSEIEACAAIGNFFLNKNNLDYGKTESDILNLGITSVVVAENNIIVTLCRPGLLIGPKGQTIKALEESLKKKVFIKEDENQLLNHLIPYDPMTNIDDFDFDDDGSDLFLDES